MTDQLDLFSVAVPLSAPPDDTDAGWLLRFLWDGRPHSLNEILRASFDQRGCGLTVHSRASDLRGLGFDVENDHAPPPAKRGDASVYRLIR